MQELKFFLARAWNILCPGARIYSSSWYTDLLGGCIQPLSCWPFVPGWPKESQRPEGPAALICSSGRPVAIAWETVFSDREFIALLMVLLYKPTNPSVSVPDRPTDRGAVWIHYIDPSHVVKSLVLMDSVALSLSQWGNGKTHSKWDAAILLLPFFKLGRNASPRPYQLLSRQIDFFLPLFRVAKH